MVLLEGQEVLVVGQVVQAVQVGVILLRRLLLRQLQGVLPLLEIRRLQNAMNLLMCLRLQGVGLGVVILPRCRLLRRRL